MLPATSIYVQSRLPRYVAKDDGELPESPQPKLSEVSPVGD